MSMTSPKVCILSEEDARALEFGGIAHSCASRRHHHISRAKVDSLVKAGEMMWVGKHKKVAAHVQARTWRKTYRRNQYGEVASCGMQMVRGGAAH